MSGHHTRHEASRPEHALDNHRHDKAGAALGKDLRDNPREYLAAIKQINSDSQQFGSAQLAQSRDAVHAPETIDFAAHDPYAPAVGDAQKSESGHAASDHARTSDTQADVSKPSQSGSRQPLQEPLDSESFCDAARKLITMLDPNHSGHVSKADLARAIADKSITGQNAQTLAAVYQHFDALSTEKNASGKSVLSATDIDKYQSMIAATDKVNRQFFAMHDWSKSESFNKYLNNGVLTKTDLESLVKAPSTPEADREQFNFIKDHFGEIAKVNASSVTKADLDSFYDARFKNEKYARAVNEIPGVINSVCESQNSRTQSLYADTANPLASINSEAIKQGSLGDCSFLSALASQANLHPQQIKDMIKDNSDGTYTVTFPGAPNEPITVTDVSEVEQGIYNNGSKNGTWASVVEKAYGQYMKNHDKDNHYSSDDTPQKSAENSWDVTTMKLLLGTTSKIW